MLRIDLAVPGWNKRALLMEAGEVSRHPLSRTSDALQEMVLMVERGGVPPDTSVVVAIREDTGGGHPAVVVCVPFDDETISLWQSGDPSAMGDVYDALEDAVEVFLDQVKRGKMN